MGPIFRSMRNFEEDLSHSEQSKQIQLEDIINDAYLPFGFSWIDPNSLVCDPKIQLSVGPEFWTVVLNDFRTLKFKLFSRTHAMRCDAPCVTHTNHPAPPRHHCFFYYVVVLLLSPVSFVLVLPTTIGVLLLIEAKINGLGV